MDRRRTLGIEHRTAVSVNIAIAIGVVLRATGRKRAESRTDAALGRAVHTNAFLRCAEDDRGTARARLCHQSETSPAITAADGTGSDLSEATAVKACAWPSDLPLPAAQCCDYTTGPGVVERHHVYPAPCGFHLSGRRHGLVQPLCVELGNLNEPGFGILLLGVRPRTAAGPSRNLQYRPGAQFTSGAFTSRLDAENILISMDGRGRALDNVFVERLWRSVKYEDVYLKDYNDPRDAIRNLALYFTFYNRERPHQALGYQTPDAVYCSSGNNTRRPLRGSFS